MIGRLAYLMGPSSSGEDSLLQATREPLALHDCHVMRRAIARSAEAVGEDAQAMTPTQFDTLERVSAFIMSWRTNGLCYGIPVQIDEWLVQGYDVLVNDSRDYLMQTRRRYPDLLAVLLGVKLEVLRQHLPARGRENPEKIETHLARNAESAVDLEGPLFQLDNSGDLDDALRSLLTCLGSDRTCA